MYYHIKLITEVSVKRNFRYTNYSPKMDSEIEGKQQNKEKHIFLKNQKTLL